MHNPTLVILAAGMGSRYGGLKQLAGLGPGGEVLMEYSIYDALQSGFGKIVFIIRRDIESDFTKLIVPRLPQSIDFEYVFQELDSLPHGYQVTAGRTKPLGTAHALWCARHAVNENFAVLNADDFYGGSGFRRLAQLFKQPEADGYLLGYRLDRTLSESGPVTRGICRQTGVFLASIEEVEGLAREGNDITSQNSKTRLSGNELVSMNFWGFTPSIFSHLETRFIPWLEENGNSPKAEFLLPSLVGSLVSDSAIRIKVEEAEDEWIGVTYPTDNEPVRQKLRNLGELGVYPKPLW